MCINYLEEMEILPYFLLHTFLWSKHGAYFTNKHYLDTNSWVRYSGVFSERQLMLRSGLKNTLVVFLKM